VNDDLHHLAFELSLRSLAQQEAALNELRARTGTILAASSLVASFLGARAVAGGGSHYGWLTALGFAAFTSSLAAAAYVLWAKSGLVFSLRGTALMRAEDDDPQPSACSGKSDCGS